MKTAVLISGLLLILVANIMMAYYYPRGMSYGKRGRRMGPRNFNEKFQNDEEDEDYEGFQVDEDDEEGFQNTQELDVEEEGFNSYYLENSGGAKEKYTPVGAFDGVKLSTGNSVSGWRYTAPNEPLKGAEFSPDADNLFMFKNNQCKPECCGASFSCGGGCVCTTPQQRQYIAGRGGNKTGPEDSP